MPMQHIMEMKYSFIELLIFVGLSLPLFGSEHF